MPMDMRDPNQPPLNPLVVLSYYERCQERKPLTDEQRQAYEELIEMFRKLNDDESIARSLLIKVELMASEGAAIALQNTPVSKVQRRIRELLHNILIEDPDTIKESRVDLENHRLRGMGLPLTLANSNDPSDIELLCRAACFRRQRSPIHKDDDRFRKHAVNVLGTFDADLARETLFMLLCSPRIEPDLRSAVVEALQSQLCPSIRRRCSDLRTLPRRAAVKQLARLSGSGFFRSHLDSLFHRSDYDSVFSSLEMLTLGE